MKTAKQSIDLEYKGTKKRLNLRTALISLCMFAFVGTSAQTGTVTVKLRNASVKELFSAIEKQTSYRFSYRDAEIKGKGNVTISATNRELKQLLEGELSKLGLKYAVSGNKIIVTPAAAVPSAQPKKVTGKVVDANGEPVIGATIKEQGTANGTITDFDGNFTLDVADNAMLEVSYIGYKSQELKAVAGKMLSVTLREDTEVLDEVVVVGYGTQKKVNLTGSVETVGAERIADKPVTSIVSALTGEAAGVTITQTSGQPGPNQGTVRVRGIGTWGDASPLVLVDGVSMSLNDVIPSEVESVSVLKDAASAAIYGSRAANGVILITTKKGKEGKLSFNYSGNVGVQFATRVPQMATSWQYAELYNQMMANEGKSSSLFPQDRIERMKVGGDPDKLEGNTDWYDEILKQGAFQQNHQISVNGGTEKVAYMVSAGYSDQKGVLPSTDYQRYNLRINTTSQLTSWLKMNVNIAYLNGLQEESAAGASDAYRRVARALPYMPVRFSDGTWSYSTSPTNPVRRLTDDYGMRKKYNDVLTLLVSPEINPLEGLNIKGVFGYESNIYREKTFNKTVTYEEFEPAGQSGITEVTRNQQLDRWDQYRNLTANATITYEKNIAKHYFKILGGTSLETFKWCYTKASRYDFPNNDFEEINAGDATTAAAEGNSTYAALASFFGRAEYNYAERYLLELTARYDGSSKFARGHRWGFFPAVSAAWRISEESFFEPLKESVQNLKLRLSWGELGNQNISDYQYASTIGTGGSYILGESLANGYAELIMGNELITWESSKNINFGVDFGLFNNRLQASFDWYRRITSDILLQLEAPSSLGIYPSMTNAGEMENKGWDLTLNWRSKIGKDFNYHIGFNLSDVKNEVTDLRGYKSPTSELTAKIEGEPLNAIFGWETLGICENQETYEQYVDVMKTYNNNWNIGDIIIKDRDKNGVIDSNDKTVIGNQIPRFTYGINLGFDYKGFDFSCFFQGVGKVDGYVTDELLTPMGLNSARKEHYEETFNPKNPQPGCYFPRVLENTYNYGYMQHWVQDASYLRLKNLQIGYTFNIKGFNKFRIYLSGQNLFTITKFRTWDPETPVGARGAYPQVAVYSAGINLNF